MQGTVEVTDLFKGAFLLCMGGRLDRVRIRNNGRRIATFLITGKDLDRLDSDYRVWFKNSSAPKKPKIHHDSGKIHKKSHPRRAKHKAEIFLHHVKRIKLR
jgi:hypothetical protein